MFQPSTSWVSKAGVHLDYAPEDTTRSILFTPPSSQVADIQLSSRNDMMVEFRDIPDGSLGLDTHECHSPNTQRITWNDSNGVDTSKHSEVRMGKVVQTRRTTTKPAPFLRRRQGMAAWCSKIRRQGLPVQDPAEQLRKKQACSSNVVRTAIGIARKNPTSPPLQPNIPNTTVLNLPPTHANSQSKKPFTALFRGCVDRSTNGAIAHEPSGDDKSVCQEANCEPSNDSKTIRTSHEEVQTDMGDLEEFELLEEIAENSSFSSLTTSFVSKLGKSALRDRLKKAEERLHRLSLMDRETSDEMDDAGHGNQPSDTRVISSSSALNLLDFPNGTHDGPPSSTDQSETGLTRTASLNRFESSILTTDCRNKTKKVARFHLVPNFKSTSKSSQSPEATLHESQTGIPLSHPACENSWDGAHESTDFDDKQSWDQRPHEETAERFHEAVQGNLPEEASRLLPRSVGTSPDGRPSNTAFSGEPTNSILPHIYHLDPIPSRTSSEGADKVLPVEDSKLVTLADQFLGTLNRDTSSIGRSTSESYALLRQWIDRLEQEVKRFKTENSNLQKLKTERENALKNLEKEAKQFEDYKTKELRALDEYKQNEEKKFKKERRILDEYQRALKSMPNKKDRDEIERLRAELQESRAELSRREVRWHSAIARLRTRIGELESERNELKLRINRLEADRISLQAQLHEAQGAHTKTGVIRRTSSTGPVRQTLNSVSQALSFKVTKHVQDKSKPSQTNAVDRREQQQRQYLSSCRLSSRASSRSAGLESLSDLGARPDVSLKALRPGSVDRHSTDKFNRLESSNRPRSTASTECARESVNSGGYFTGDDDCQSNGSDHAVSELRVDTSELKALQSERVPSGQSDHDQSKRIEESLPLPGTAASGQIIHSLEHADGSVEKTYSNGAVILNYTNGSVKEIFPDKKTVIVSLFNGDIKRTLPDGRVIYHYVADGTVQITYPDGKEEIIYADGKKEFMYPKHLHSGSQTADLSRPSSTDIISRKLPNGDREICFPNGQREIHSVSGVKCRIYPDGTTKTVFPDGRHETRYASGRLRIKDAEGNLVLDTRLPSQQSIPFALSPGD